MTPEFIAKHCSKQDPMRNLKAYQALLEYDTHVKAFPVNEQLAVRNSKDHIKIMQSFGDKYSVTVYEMKACWMGLPAFIASVEVAKQAALENRIL